ncbi:MAG: hypothetical protein P1U41_09800, partial [Vicingaceae bacterium]|nr:hypothetical protein [Vicingaceae bacterium]
QLDGETVAIKFPDVKDTLSEFVEIIYSSPIDTIYPDQNDLSKVEQVQHITITSFDSGYYKVPYFKFKINEDTLTSTDDLFIDVQTMEVDTTKAIFDIKEPLEEPFSFKDWLKDNWIWIVGILVLIIIIIVVVKYLKNRPEPIVEEVVPDIPDYIIALEKLNKLREKQLWQTGKIKQYHSEISETLRAYIETRYQINALENTTDEIIQNLRFQTLQPDVLAKLNQALMLADLVKFAKEQPLANENELSLMNAIEFVNQTKLIITPKEDNAE